MLMEIIESSKDKIIIELFLRASPATRNIEKKLLININSVFLDLLNAEISWKEIAEQGENQNGFSPYLIRELISSLEINEETKDFLKIFCFHNTMILSSRLIKMDRLLSDIKRIAEIKTITIDAAIDYINLKYTPREIKAIDDRISYRHYYPLLLANNIDFEEFRNIMYHELRKPLDKKKVLTWFKQKTDNKIHINLFLKILYRFSTNNFEETFLSLLPFDELIEYLRLQNEYENKCTKFRVSFFDEVLILTYIELLKNNISIKKCEYCGTYFISRYGAKSCSDECKNNIIEANRKNRIKKEHYANCQKALKSNRDRINYYKGKCKDLPQDTPTYMHRTQICSAFRFVNYYYSWVIKKISDTILNDNTDVLNDTVFIDNLYNWLKMISSQKCDLDNTNSANDIVFYKFSRDHFSKENFNVLLSNEKFIREVNYIFTKDGTLTKKKTTQKNK